MSKLFWYLKQLLPLTYRTHVVDQRGLAHFIVWRMWFGRCFHVEDFIVLQRPATIPLVRR